jgi:hypothetical protein
MNVRAPGLSQLCWSLCLLSCCLNTNPWCCTRTLSTQLLLLLLLLLLLTHVFTTVCQLHWLVCFVSAQFIDSLW